MALKRLSPPPRKDEDNEPASPARSSKPGNHALLASLTDEQLAKAFPALRDTSAILQACKNGKLLSKLIQNLVLIEEISKSSGEAVDLPTWRHQRWGSQAERVFVTQRTRFSRVSYYQLSLQDRGVASEYYYQLSNEEIAFQDLLARVHPAKPGESQPGIIREALVSDLPGIIAKKLHRSKPGVAMKPLDFGHTVLLIQLIEWHEPEMDAAIQKSLEKEVEQNWLQSEIASRLGTLMHTHQNDPETLTT